MAGGGGKTRLDKGGFAGLLALRLRQADHRRGHGVAMGGGFEIALACDLIIASENARFALPEPHVASQRLPAGCSDCRARSG